MVVWSQDNLHIECQIYIWNAYIYILDNKGYPLFFQMAHDITFKKREITLNVGMLYDCKHKGRDQLWK